MDKSVPRVTVWHHSAEPRDAKTVTLVSDLSVHTSHSCQILIFHSTKYQSQTYTIFVSSPSSFSFLRINFFPSLSTHNSTPTINIVGHFMKM